MTMGPEPMMRILWMSVRLGMGATGTPARNSFSVAGVVELYTLDGRATNLPRGTSLYTGTVAEKIETRGWFGVLYGRLREERMRWQPTLNDVTRLKNTWSWKELPKRGLNSGTAKSSA